MKFRVGEGGKKEKTKEEMKLKCRNRKEGAAKYNIRGIKIKKEKNGKNRSTRRRHGGEKVR
jgi:hypothetical protein